MVKVFSIYDSKAEVYSNPVFIRTKGEAIRGLAECVNNSDHHYGRHSEDFTLFEIGEWDDLTGTFMPYQAKISICNLKELIEL
ncbi:MAG: hypothetical protein QW515_05270 [Thermoplasmatales archaeon]